MALTGFASVMSSLLVRAWSLLVDVFHHVTSSGYDIITIRAPYILYYYIRGRACADCHWNRYTGCIVSRYTVLLPKKYAVLNYWRRSLVSFAEWYCRRGDMLLYHAGMLCAPNAERFISARSTCLWAFYRPPIAWGRSSVPVRGRLWHGGAINRWHSKDGLLSLFHIWC